jgi:hypothetical protein
VRPFTFAFCHLPFAFWFSFSALPRRATHSSPLPYQLAIALKRGSGYVTSQTGFPFGISRQIVWAHLRNLNFKNSFGEKSS